MEREAYDFMEFIGHPQLKRILNMDEMISFQCEKNFQWKIAEEQTKTIVSLKNHRQLLKI
jgi:NADH:ubiquinone oxidoreductase subunit C